jgi:hypothetical protein
VTEAAPAIVVQLNPDALHRRHRYLYATGRELSHVPGLAVRISPGIAVPEMLGGDVLCRHGISVGEHVVRWAAFNGRAVEAVVMVLPRTTGAAIASATPIRRGNRARNGVSRGWGC